MTSYLAFQTLKKRDETQIGLTILIIMNLRVLCIKTSRLLFSNITTHLQIHLICSNPNPSH